MIEIIPNLHPIFVHFTVAILTINGVLQLLLWLFKDKAKSENILFTQKWLVSLGVFAVLTTLASGLFAYFSVSHDSPSHLAMTDHRNWAMVTAAISLLGAAFYFMLPNNRQLLAGSCFVVSLLLVSVTAFKGGEVVYRYGLGVMSLPQVSGDGHDHDHGDEGHEPAANQTSDKQTVTTESAENEKQQHSHDQNTAHHQPDDSQMYSGLDSLAAKAVIDFHAAINTGEAVKARLFLADAVIIFEGGGVERSADQYASHHMKSDIAFLAKMKVTSMEQQVVTGQDMAVSIGRSKIQGLYKGKAIDIESMETMVLQKLNGDWRIIHIHWSN